MTGAGLSADSGGWEENGEDTDEKGAENACILYKLWE